jgi:hypothetical protein
MQIALADELVSIPVSSCFLIRSFSKGVCLEYWCQPSVGMYGAGGVAADLHLCDSACFFSSLLHELHRLDMEGAPMHAILVMAGM